MQGQQGYLTRASVVAHGHVLLSLEKASTVIFLLQRLITVVTWFFEIFFSASDMAVLSKKCFEAREPRYFWSFFKMIFSTGDQFSYDSSFFT